MPVATGIQGAGLTLSINEGKGAVILSVAPPSDTPSFSHPSADSTLSSWTCTKPLSSTYNVGVARR